MKLTLSIALFLIALSTPALAQESPPVEVFAGYSFVRPNGGGSLHGWNTSVAIRINSRMAIVSDFSGHYGSQTLEADTFDDDDFPGDISIRANSDSNVHSILAGPRFSVAPIADGRLTPFGHILMGASRLGTDASIRFGGAALDTSFADMGFAVAVGGGLDLNVSDSFGIRLIQADYFVTNFGGNSQRNARLSVGIVLH